MNLLLVRHAQSMNNHAEGLEDYLVRREPDPALTVLGRQQAHELAAWFARNELREPVVHLYSSLMTRAVQTAAPLARVLGLAAEPLVDAYECGGLNTGPAGNFTPVSGRDHDSLRLECPQLTWPQSLHGQAWSGGCEPWENAVFQARAVRVAAQLREAAPPDGLVVLVTHYDFAQFLLAELLSLPAASVHFHLENASTTYLRIRARADGTEERRLHWLNRTDHLS